MELLNTHPIKKSDLGFHGNLFGGKLLAWIDAAAAGYSVKELGKNSSVGDLFINSPEFKSLQNGKNGANMPSPFQIKASLTGGFQYKDVYSNLPEGAGGTMGHGADAIFGSVQRDPMVMSPQRIKRVRDLFPSRTTTAAVIATHRTAHFTCVPCTTLTTVKMSATSGTITTIDGSNAITVPISNTKHANHLRHSAAGATAINSSDSSSSMSA